MTTLVLDVAPRRLLPSRRPPVFGRRGAPDLKGGAVDPPTPHRRPDRRRGTACRPLPRPEPLRRLHPAEPPKTRLARRLGAFVSILLHAPVIALVVFLPAPRHPAVTRPPAIEVTLIARPPEAAPPPAAPLPAPGAPDAPAMPEPTAPPPPPETAAPPPDNGVVRPKVMLSASVMAMPQNRQAREALANLVEEEQVIQLCGVEAMEQIAAWDPSYQPLQVEAYAMADTRIDGTTLTAEGGAFLSGNAWYNVSFTCELTEDLSTVTGFSFRVGEEIPRSEWDAHYLAPPSAVDH